jgi:hypothetical protein
LGEGGLQGTLGFVFDGFLSMLQASVLSKHSMLDYLEQKTTPISGLITSYAYETPDVGYEVN